MKRILEKTAARAVDGAMCGVMSLLHLRDRDQIHTLEEMEAYLAIWSSLSREEFYRVPEGEPRWITRGDWLEWDTPVPGEYPENNQPRVRLSYCEAGPSAPTVIILHALMSANDSGYLRLARWFNARGWNAAFPHLPYHYSRRPRGYLNGELAITANLIRSAQALRQGVIELRQLMARLRAQGSPEFGVIGTSYGGWTGALLSFLEENFRFLSLIQPIVNVETTIWHSPTAFTMRRLLRNRGITRGVSERHSHLISPMHGRPLCGDEKVILTGGTYDQVSPWKELLALKERWPGAKLLQVRQGHFGYTALPATLREIEPRL